MKTWPFLLLFLLVSVTPYHSASRADSGTLTAYVVKVSDEGSVAGDLSGKADSLSMTPAESRKQKRRGEEHTTKPPSSAVTRGAFSCEGPRKRCGEMASCDEAYFHLKSCDNKRLDRDKDGIPCESICQ